MAMTESEKDQFSREISGVREEMVRFSEQMMGVREDIGEMKSSLKTATDIMGQLHVSYVPRSEIEKMAVLREREKTEQDKQIRTLWKQVDKLRAWRAWLTGAYVVAGGALILLFEFGKQWLSGTAH